MICPFPADWVLVTSFLLEAAMFSIWNYKLACFNSLIEFILNKSSNDHSEEVYKYWLGG